MTHEALKETFREFNVSRKDIAERSGVSGSMISRYLDGKNDIGSKKLQKIIDCLEEDAKSFFYSLVESSSPAALPNRSHLLQSLKSYLGECSQMEYLEVLGVMIAARQRRKQGTQATNGKAESNLVAAE